MPLERFSTSFETTFIAHQPKSLSWLAAKTVAFRIIMITDCLAPTFNKLKPCIQYKIALHLNGKWLGQFISSHGSSLSTIETCMDQSEPSKMTTLAFFYRFFCELRPITEDYSFYNLMADCYISEKCNNFICLPSKLFFLGIRDNLKVMSNSFLEPCNEYFSSCSIKFKPKLNPLPASLQFFQFDNAIYSTHVPTIAQTLCQNWDETAELPRRLTWANYYVGVDRYPEALVQLLECCNIIDPKIHSDVECFNLMGLLINVAANLHFNIKCQTFIIMCALSLVTLSFQICEFIPGIIAIFRELGNFEWAKIVFLKRFTKNRFSQFYTLTLENYAESIIDNCENIILYINGIQEYHRDCKISRCDATKSQGSLRKKLFTLSDELNAIINKMHPSPETDLFKAQCAIVKAFIYKFQGCHRKYLCSIDEIRNLFTLISDTAEKPITKLKVTIFNLVFLGRGPALFRDIIADKIGRLNTSTLSILKGKLYFKSAIIMLLFYKREIETVANRACLNGYIDSALDSFFLVSNHKHYRIRLLRSFEKIFYHHFSHRYGDRAALNKQQLGISLHKNALLCYYLFPNFPELALISRQHLISNVPWFPKALEWPQICNVNRLIALDPFIKNHISFGASQLKYKNE